MSGHPNQLSPDHEAVAESQVRHITGLLDAFGVTLEQTSPVVAGNAMEEIQSRLDAIKQRLPAVVPAPAETAPLEPAIALGDGDTLWGVMTAEQAARSPYGVTPVELKNPD